MYNRAKTDGIRSQEKTIHCSEKIGEEEKPVLVGEPKKQRGKSYQRETKRCYKGGKTVLGFLEASPGKAKIRSKQNAEGGDISKKCLKFPMSLMSKNKAKNCKNNKRTPKNLESFASA